MSEQSVQTVVHAGHPSHLMWYQGGMAGEIDLQYRIEVLLEYRTVHAGGKQK